MHRFGQHVQQQFVGYIALFVALGGVSYAAVTLPANSVGSRQIKPFGVKASDVGMNAISASRVKDGSLTAADFAPGQLSPGAPGKTGAKGDTGLTGATGDPGPAGPSTGRATGDLTGSYPNPAIAPGVVTADKLAPPAAETAVAPPSRAGNCLPGGAVGEYCSESPSGFRIWQAYGSPYGAARFYRDNQRVVHLAGLVRGWWTAGSGPNQNTPADPCTDARFPIFVLPIADRPATLQIFAADSNQAHARVDVATDGTVTCVRGRGDQYLSLDGIAFRASG